jgi:membrane protein YdbS with pleckstrin-like domain
MELRCNACGVRVKPHDVYCRRCGARNAAADELEANAELAAEDLAKQQTTLSMTEHVRSGIVGPARRLDEDEVVLWHGTFCWKAMIREGLVAIALTAILLAIRGRVSDPQIAATIIPAIAAVWLLVAALLVYRKLDAGYTITNQRLIHKHGILYRRTHRIEAIDIDDLRYEQGILEQLIGVGRINIYSSDATHGDLVMYGIAHVGSVFDILEKARRRERLQHGLHVESI